MTKRKIKNRKSSMKYKAYKVEGGKAVIIKKVCPKCGPAMFLAEHKDRLYCGSCHYLQMKK